MSNEHDWSDGPYKAVKKTRINFPHATEHEWCIESASGRQNYVTSQHAAELIAAEWNLKYARYVMVHA